MRLIIDSRCKSAYHSNMDLVYNLFAYVHNARQSSLAYKCIKLQMVHQHNFLNYDMVYSHRYLTESHSFYHGNLYYIYKCSSVGYLSVSIK